MICVPLKKKTISTLLSDLKKAQKIADIVEIWQEKNLAAADLKKIFKIKKKPFIFKITTLFSLIAILSHNPEFVDLDLKTPLPIITKIKKQFPKTQIILSHHDFEKTPSDKELSRLIRTMQKKHADIIKIATFANDTTDSLRMLRLLSELSKQQRAILLSMGIHGRLTRTAGHLFGNYLMYAPLSLREKTADGQITAKDLKEIQTLIPKLCR
jgi:3-dehydroquinate dehydratase type I